MKILTTAGVQSTAGWRGRTEGSDGRPDGGSSGSGGLTWGDARRHEADRFDMFKAQTRTMETCVWEPCLMSSCLRTRLVSPKSRGGRRNRSEANHVRQAIPLPVSRCSCLPCCSRYMSVVVA